MHINPDSGLLWDRTGRWILVTGHTDDPLADTCHYVYPENWTESPMPDKGAHATCRSSFVATSIQRASAGLHVNGFARVVVPELNLRLGPSTSAESIRYPYGPNPVRYGAKSGVDDLFILDGPVTADGYHWWYVAPTEYLNEPYPPTGETFALPDPVGSGFQGWVAAGDTRDDWLVPVASACPVGPVELEDVVYRVASWAVRMGCFRGQTLTFRGWLPAGEPASSSIFVRPWTWGPITTPDPSMADLDRLDFEVYPSGLSLPAPGQWIEITGQFDHPNVGDTGPRCGEDAEHITCRSSFVATAVRALGTEP